MDEIIVELRQIQEIQLKMHKFSPRRSSARRTRPSARCESQYLEIFKVFFIENNLKKKTPTFDRLLSIFILVVFVHLNVDFLGVVRGALLLHFRCSADKCNVAILRLVLLDDLQTFHLRFFLQKLDSLINFQNFSRKK